MRVMWGYGRAPREVRAVASDPTPEGWTGCFLSVVDIGDVVS